ncbi:MAG: GNAT family N-acetyltransferase [Desulfobacterales bacterium]|nr:GNAT family N-acetyltransferase [Desulfobacterales bacterium]
MEVKEEGKDKPVGNGFKPFPTKSFDCPPQSRAKKMIRKCTQQDLSVMYEIINDAAQAYQGVIPEDRWQEPYMPIEELKHEIDDGVEFWGYEEAGDLIGVMGLQDKGDVYLIRHAYVYTSSQSRGIGRELLRHLERTTDKPMLIGTWANATWAIRFYEKNGYRLLSRSETERLLKKYWKIPARQVVTSVVLANSRWEADKKNGDDVQ